MIRIVTYEELYCYIRNLTEDIAKTIFDVLEDIKKLIAELMDIPEEKQSYQKYSFSVFIIVCIMHYKRLWKRQKIP